jgi:hypothetical protein
MFDKDKPGFNLLNTDCRIYQAISEMASITRAIEPLRFGRMYYRQISGDGVHFGFPYGTTYTLAFSRILYPSEVLIAYNVSGQAREDFVLIDAPLHAKVGNMSYLYGNSGKVKIQDSPDGASAKFVRLSLAPYQFVILQ